LLRDRQGFMLTCARLLCVLLLFATTAAAQSTTEDGIRAMLRGDYRAAVAILRPLADDTSRPDPAAQFFLAILYDTGHAGDSARACGLFKRVARSASPFSEQAGALGTVVQEQLGTAAPTLCVADEGWQGGPPQSFVLGPDHRIVFADTSVRVTYGDKEQGTSLLLPPGVAFLPIQYTPLTVTRPTATRRHFFQWLGWMPDTTVQTSSWTLVWQLSEVVDGQWILIAHEKALAVANGPISPASTDVKSLVRLSVNGSGAAEFTIMSGNSPRTEVIPPQGSR
jgi:hypothetical protein